MAAAPRRDPGNSGHGPVGRALLVLLLAAVGEHGIHVRHLDPGRRLDFVVMAAKSPWLSRGAVFPALHLLEILHLG